MISSSPFSANPTYNREQAVLLPNLPADQPTVFFESPQSLKNQPRRVYCRSGHQRLIVMRQQDHAFLLRFGAMVGAGCAEGCWFRFRPPDNGHSNDGWLRSGTSLVRFALDEMVVRIASARMYLGVRRLVGF
jgi:hypothetical protein